MQPKHVFALILCIALVSGATIQYALVLGQAKYCEICHQPIDERFLVALVDTSGRLHFYGGIPHGVTGYHQFNTTTRELYVTDYNLQQLVNAFTAAYVDHPTIHCPICNSSILAFFDNLQAQTFISRFGGTIVENPFLTNSSACVG